MVNLIHKDLTYCIIGAAFEVWRVLGYGFLEAVYHRAMSKEMELIGIKARSEHPIDVFYKEHAVGFYVLDFLVEGKVIVEIKTERILNRKHEPQLLNYLAATGVKVGLLMTFGRLKCSYRRMVLENPRSAYFRVLPRLRC